MASVQKPTKTQLRQHALDRAIQPDLVQAIAAGLADEKTMHAGKPKAVCQAIIATADRFAEWLEGAEEPQANLELATTQELLEELNARSGSLEHMGHPEDARFLNAYTVDVSGRLSPEALAYRTVDA